MAPSSSQPVSNLASCCSVLKGKRQRRRSRRAHSGMMMIVCGTERSGSASEVCLCDETDARCYRDTRWIIRSKRSREQAKIVPSAVPTNTYPTDTIIFRASLLALLLLACQSERYCFFCARKIHQCSAFKARMLLRLRLRLTSPSLSLASPSLFLSFVLFLSIYLFISPSLSSTLLLLF